MASFLRCELPLFLVATVVEFLGQKSWLEVVEYAISSGT